MVTSIASLRLREEPGTERHDDGKEIAITPMPVASFQETSGDVEAAGDVTIPPWRSTILADTV
jgi:hypothetical protein